MAGKMCRKMQGLKTCKKLRKVDMDLENTTLDDIAAVIGFSATVRLAAWYGDGNNLYVPSSIADGQALVNLIGVSAAKKLSQEWGGEHLSIPRLRNYEDDERRRLVARMLENGFGTREISGFIRRSERRVQQIQRELESAGLLDPVAPRKKVVPKFGE